MEYNDRMSDSWTFEKEIVFEDGAAVAMSVSYNNVTPEDTIKVVSGLEFLLKEIEEKVRSLKEVIK